MISAPRKLFPACFRAAVLLCWVLLLPTAAAASDVQVYRIAPLPVDVTASTAAQARDQAVREVQRKALDRLWTRLVDQDSISLIPVLDDAAIAGLVAGLEFRNERYSARRYIADISVTFSQAQVRQILDTTGVPYSEAVARPVLVLPVMGRADEGLDIWEKNIFRTVWLDYGWDGNLVPFIVPEGSDYERAMMGPVQIRLFDREAFQQLADVYDAADAVLLLVQPLYGSPTSPAASVMVRKLSDAEDMPGLMYRFGDPYGNVTAGDPSMSPDLRLLLNEVTATLGASLTADWRRITQVQGGQSSSLLANIPLSSLSDWLAAQRRLQQVGIIRGLEVSYLRVRQAQVRLNFLGNVEQLTLSLAEAGIDLMDQSGNWVLYFR